MKALESGEEPIPRRFYFAEDETRNVYEKRRNGRQSSHYCQLWRQREQPEGCRRQQFKGQTLEIKDKLPQGATRAEDTP